MTLYRFQTTYEELKLGVRQTRQFKKLRLPDYLWGIETVIPAFWIWNVSASRLPMRNWNSPSGEQCSSDRVASRLPMRNWNATWETSQATRSNASRLPMRNWNPQAKEESERRSLRFQTTYEELKLSNIRAIDGGKNASRLPMRNWNPLQPSTPITDSAMLPDYLWGIETRL